MADILAKVADVQLQAVDSGFSGFEAALVDGFGNPTGDTVQVLRAPPLNRAVVVLEWRGNSLHPEVAALIGRLNRQ